MTMENTTTKVMLKNLSPEQLQNLENFAAAQGMTMTLTNKHNKNIDHLNYVDEEKTTAICLADNAHQFDIGELDEELAKKCKQTGLCPKCLSVLDEALHIKSCMARTRKFVDNQPSEEKAGYQIREILKNNIDNINDDLALNLQDADFCKQKFKLSYPMLLDITDKNTEEVKLLRKDSKGYNRYSPQIYMINNNKYLLTNNLYPKNLTLIREYFEKL